MLSLTSDSTALVPSACARVMAPKPACQICWAESLTEPVKWTPAAFGDFILCSLVTKVVLREGGNGARSKVASENVASTLILGESCV